MQDTATRDVQSVFLDGGDDINSSGEVDEHTEKMIIQTGTTVCYRFSKALVLFVLTTVAVLFGAVQVWVWDALGLSKRRAQADIQELEASLGAEMPYEIAAEALARCAGINVSNRHTHDVLNEVADGIQLLDICPEKADIHSRIDAIYKNRSFHELMLPGKWMRDHHYNQAADGVINWLVPRYRKGGEDPVWSASYILANYALCEKTGIFAHWRRITTR